MIPVRLEVRDFLSYADPVTIDFTGFDVACLTGPNGSGKSALLDSMTWALWGSARGCEGGLHQERLIRDGADEACVDFTFELNGQTYRVVRRRSRSGKSDVRFELDGSDGARNLGGQTLRETDEKIGSTLRMDYRTFIASAFFVQGRSDDFLRMRPDERKRVFSQLLDLDTYERLAEISRIAAREAEARRSKHAADVEQHAGARDEAERVRCDLEAARGEADAAGAAVEAARSAAEDARTESAEHAKLTAIVGTEREQLDALDARLAALEGTIDRKSATLADIDALLARTDEVDEALAEAERLRRKDEEARVRQEQAAELGRRRAGILGQIEAERNNLIANQADAEKRIARLQLEATELERVQSEIDAIEAAITEIGDPRGEIDDVRRQLDAHAAAAARLEEQAKALDVRIAEAAEKVALLERGEGECPVCGTALDAPHRARAKKHLEAESRAGTKKRDAACSALETARKERARCTEDLERLQRTVGELDNLIASRAGLAGRLERRAALTEELRATEVELRRAADLITDGAFAGELRAELEAVLGELDGLYDAEAHRRVIDRLRELQPYEALKGRLVEAGRARDAVVAEIGESTRAVEEGRAEREGRCRRLSGLEERLERSAGVAETAARAEEGLRTALEAATEAATRVAALTERLDAATRDELALETAEEAERDSALERRRYGRLAEAFGRNGIPQLIIENERPQLEHETNRILDRLTDDPMAVQFLFQKDTKAGKTRETLDVLVRPHDGDPRDFAMFSGGEAFRIAFAVRLAMSKLLVRRAGARLETLVIDEGFGTQDPQGRERLLEAINLAREEFAKVLVITHLDDMKDQFGVQIVVRRHAGASVIDIDCG